MKNSAENNLSIFLKQQILLLIGLLSGLFFHKFHFVLILLIILNLQLKDSSNNFIKIILDNELENNKAIILNEADSIFTCQ